MQVALENVPVNGPLGVTIERWQNGKDSRTVSTYATSTYTILEHEGHTYSLIQGEAIPDAASAALKSILHPGPSPEDLAGTTPELRKQNFGKATLDCVMLTRPIVNLASAPLGLFPTYCLSSGDRLNVSYDFGSQTVLRKQVGKFLDHEVTMESSVLSGEHLLATGKVLALSTFVPKQDEFEPSPEMVASAVTVIISGGVIQGQRIKAVQPIYPESARRSRISGTVLLKACIGMDGHVRSLTPVNGPDPSLVLAAILAVRQWVYKPYLLNGVPTDINTTITVNFNLRPS